MFLYKYKKKCLPGLHLLQNDSTWSQFLSAKKQTSHPGTQILSQIPEDREGNRGQMLHLCPGSPPPSPPPLGLTIDRCIILKTDKHSINCFTYLKSAQYKICKVKYEYFEIKYLYLFYIYFFYLFDFFHYYYYIPLPV